MDWMNKSKLRKIYPTKLNRYQLPWIFGSSHTKDIFADTILNSPWITGEPGSSVGIETDYGLDGPRIEF
jgi:hypothetical protein